MELNVYKWTMKIEK